MNEWTPRPGDSSLIRRSQALLVALKVSPSENCDGLPFLATRPRPIFHVTYTGERCHSPERLFEPCPVPGPAAAAAWYRCVQQDNFLEAGHAIILPGYSSF
jgi:hypothetical protein